MKRGISMLAVTSLILGTMASTGYAATTANASQARAKIVMNGKVVTNPYTLVAKLGKTNTTYMPLFYIDEALKNAGYQVKWNGKTWSLTNKSVTPQLPWKSVGKGDTAIEVNGKVVQRVNKIVRKDLAGGKHAVATAYLPVWYVQLLLKGIGVQNTWNGTKHEWSAVTPVMVAKAKSTYGPAKGNRKVSRDLVITGSQTNVRNLEINGNLFVNPGANGTVTLQGLKVSGTIYVLSGATKSIHLINDDAHTLDIASSTAVRIDSEGSTNIGTTELSANDNHPVILNQTGGSMGNIFVGSKASLSLEGNKPFKSVTVESDAKVVVNSGVKVADLSVPGSQAAVTVAQNATVVTVSVGGTKASITVAKGATVTNISADGSEANITIAEGAKVIDVSIKGTSVNVSVAKGATVANITVSGAKANVNVATGATVTSLNVNGADTHISVAKGATVKTVNVANVSGVKITNDGNIDTLNNKGSSSNVTVSGNGKVTTVKGNAPSTGENNNGSTTPTTTPTTTPSGGGGGSTGGGGGGSSSGGSGGSTGGGGGSTTTGNTTESAALSKLVTALNDVKANVASTGGTAAIDSAGSALNSIPSNNPATSTVSSWESYINDAQSTDGESVTTVSSVTPVMKDLIGFATYGQLSGDTSTTSGNVSQVLADFQKVDPSVTGSDLYNFFETFKQQLIVAALSDYFNNTNTSQSAVSSISGIQTVTTALKYALNNTSANGLPLSTGSTGNNLGSYLWTNYGVSANDVGTVYTETLPTIDPSGSARNALTLAVGETYLSMVPETSINAKAYELQTANVPNSSIPSGFNVTGSVYWATSTGSLTPTLVPSSTSSYYLDVPGGLTVTAKVHGYAIFQFSH